MSALSTSRLLRRRAGRRLADLLDQLEVVVWEQPRRTQGLAYVNERVEQMLGVDSERFKQKGMWEALVHPEDLTRVLEAWARIDDEDGVECEYRMVRPDGAVVWVLELTQRLRRAGGRRGDALRGVLIDVTERVEAAESLRHLALHDSLTGLANRTYLRDRLEVALADAAANDGVAALLMMDLDQFKEVNDALGHQVGDMLLREIGGRLARLLDQEGGRVQRLAAELRAAAATVVLLAARGSSDNAGVYGKYLFGALVGLPVAQATPSLYTLYNQPPRVEGGLVIGISQSGQSPDICAVVEHARASGAPTVAITNDPASRLAQAADHVIQLHAGPERSIAATKTYTAQLLALALLAAHMADSQAHIQALAPLPDLVARTLAIEARVVEVAERYRYMERCVVIGRGYNYATAYELALKLKELTYVLAEPYSSADFRHGPLALIEDGSVLVIAPQSDAVYGEVVDLLKRLGERGAERLVVSDGAEALAEARSPVPLPVSVAEWLSPFTAIVPSQLFALALTLAKGYDPDHPRGLRKVTETR